MQSNADRTPTFFPMHRRSPQQRQTQANTSVRACVVRASFVAASFMVMALATAFAGAEQAHAQGSLRPMAPGHWSYDLVRELDAAGIGSAWVIRSRPVLGRDLTAALSAPESDAFGRAAQAWALRLSAELGDDSRPALLGVSAGGLKNDAEATKASGGYGGFTFDLQASEGVGVWAEGVISSQEDASELHSGGLSMATENLHFMGGRVRSYAGGTATPLVLNGQAGLDGFGFGTRRPVRFPGALGHIGQFQFHAMVTPSVSTPTVDRSWFATYGFSWDPISAVSFGATRTVRFAGEGLAPLNASNLWDMLTSGGGDSDFDDSQGAVSMRTRLKAGPVRLATYVVLGFEDLVSIKEDPAVVAGFSLPMAMDAGLLTLGYEFNAIGRRGRWCDCDYKTHRWYTQREFGEYKVDGTFLGSPLGGYGAGHYIRGSFWSTPYPVRVTASVFMEKREEANLLSSRWPDSRNGLRLDVGLGPWEGLLTEVGFVTSSTDQGSEHGFDLSLRVYDLFGVLEGR